MVNEFTTPEPAGAGVHKGHLARRIIATLISILLVLSAGTVAYLAFLNRTVTTSVKHAALQPTRTAGESLPVPVRNPQAKTHRTLADQFSGLSHS
jgi:hypothetical protein